MYTRVAAAVDYSQAGVHKILFRGLAHPSPTAVVSQLLSCGMEAAALCESIFQFVGRGGPEHVSTSHLPMPSTKTTAAVRAGEAGEGATTAEAGAGTMHNGQPATQPLPVETERSSSTTAAAASPKHQAENEEIMRAFVGNKARGVLWILIHVRELFESTGIVQARFFTTNWLLYHTRYHTCIMPAFGVSYQRCVYTCLHLLYILSICQV